MNFVLGFVKPRYRMGDLFIRMSPVHANGTLPSHSDMRLPITKLCYRQLSKCLATCPEDGGQTKLL